MVILIEFIAKCRVMKETVEYDQGKPQMLKLLPSPQQFEQFRLLLFNHNENFDLISIIYKQIPMRISDSKV